MNIVIVKTDTYRTHGKVNIDDNKLRLTLDMDKIDFYEFKRILKNHGINLEVKEHLTTAST